MVAEWIISSASDFYFFVAFASRFCFIRWFVPLLWIHFLLLFVSSPLHYACTVWLSFSCSVLFSFGLIIVKCTSHTPLVRLVTWLIKSAISYCVCVCTVRNSNFKDSPLRIDRLFHVCICTASCLHVSHNCEIQLRITCVDSCRMIWSFPLILF